MQWWITSYACESKLAFIRGNVRGVEVRFSRRFRRWFSMFLSSSVITTCSTTVEKTSSKNHQPHANVKFSKECYVSVMHMPARVVDGVWCNVMKFAILSCGNFIVVTIKLLQSRRAIEIAIYVRSSLRELHNNRGGDVVAAEHNHLGFWVACTPYSSQWREHVSLP